MGAVVWGKGIKSDPQLLRAGLSFRCNTWGKGEKGIACSKCWNIHSRFLRSRAMTNEGTKRNVPHLPEAQHALVCILSINETLKC